MAICALGGGGVVERVLEDGGGTAYGQWGSHVVKVRGKCECGRLGGWRWWWRPVGSGV